MRTIFIERHPLLITPDAMIKAMVADPLIAPREVTDAFIEMEKRKGWNMDNDQDAYSKFFRELLGNRKLSDYAHDRFDGSVRALDLFSNTTMLHDLSRFTSLTRGISVGHTDFSEFKFRENPAISHFSMDVRDKYMWRTLQQEAKRIGGFNLITVRPIGGYASLEHNNHTYVHYTGKYPNQAIPWFSRAIEQLYNLASVDSGIFLQVPSSCLAGLPFIEDVLNNSGIYTEIANVFTMNNLRIEKDKSTPIQVHGLAEPLIAGFVKGLYYFDKINYDKIANQGRQIYMKYS